MKIDNSAKTIGSVQNPVGSRAAATGATATAVKPGPAPGGQSSSTVVSATMNAVSGSEAVFDSQKVAEIRQAISEGRFKINPERIADGLISSVREMLGQNRQPTQ